MAIAPQKFRDRPRTTSIEDGDIFPLSRMSGGTATTYSIAWSDMSAQIVSEVAEARQDMVDAFAEQQAWMEGELANKVASSLIGASNGIAPLDSSSKIPSAYLPAYVDDVLEYANLAAMPVTGETGKIYIALDTNFEYRWSGSVYVRLVASPGTTDALTEGTTNKYFTDARAQTALASALGLKADSSALPGAATATPLVSSGNGAIGTATKYAREDHVHPAPAATNGNTLVGTATVGETGLTLLAISVRRVNVAVTGVVTGKNYLAVPVAALPAGFGIVDTICTTNGTLTFGMIVPIITGSYSIQVRVLQLNT